MEFSLFLPFFLDNYHHHCHVRVVSKAGVHLPPSADRFHPAAPCRFAARAELRGHSDAHEAGAEAAPTEAEGAKSHPGRSLRFTWLVFGGFFWVFFFKYNMLYINIFSNDSFIFVLMDDFLILFMMVLTKPFGYHSMEGCRWFLWWFCWAP